jgi:molecular chaperone DnaK
VEIHVVQGERQMAADNRTLARFQLTGIPPAPRGIPQIEVNFDIDANGILNVKATDLGTGKEQHIEIKSSSGLSDAEVEKMRKEAESHADEDRRRRELAEIRNQADQLVYATEKTVKEYGNKLSEGERKDLEAALDDLRKTKDSDDKETIQRKMEKVQTASHRLAEAIYQQSRARQTGGGTSGGGSSQEQRGEGEAGDNVVDAEFEVKD